MDKPHLNALVNGDSTQQQWTDDAMEATSFECDNVRLVPFPCRYACQHRLRHDASSQILKT